MQKTRASAATTGAGKSLWHLSVKTTPEAEPAISKLLAGLAGQPVSLLTLAHSAGVTVSVYLSSKADWRAIRPGLELGLKLLQAAGVPVGSRRIDLHRLPPADWRQAWKRHFRPLNLGGRLLVKPSWSRRHPRPGQAVVILDPGLSFGTGQHPTTAFCLEQVVAWRRAAEKQSFLDVGTGSGILAIAAARLGYRPVQALELDSEALRVAAANARRNRVAGAVEFQHQDVRRLSRRPAVKFDLVCANLTADLLLQERERLIARVTSGGLLVLAGILRREFVGIQRAYVAGGLRLSRSQTQGEWRSGSFLGR